MSKFTGLAASVAQAEELVAEASDRLRAAQSERDRVSGLIAEKQAQVSALRARLTAGEVTETEAAGLAGLWMADIDDLGIFDKDAAAAVAQAAAVADDAQNGLEKARRNLDGAVGKAQFQHMHDRVKDLERAYLDGLAELAAMAGKAGLSNSAVHGYFSISNHLVRVTQGVVPPRGV